MSSTPRPHIPPLAGLASYAEAARHGLSVEENVGRMRRYNYVQRRLSELAAAFMNPTPEWEVKTALSLHMWLDTEHCQALRGRVAELRRPPLYLDSVPDARLAALMDEALRAANTLELVAGIYGVIRPALLRAYQEHLVATNPIFDQPTCRLLRIAAQEQEQMIAWGEQALAALAADEEARRRAQAWTQHLAAYLEHAGGISGQAPIPADTAPPAPRASGPFVPSCDPQRDQPPSARYNFTSRYHSVYNDTAVDRDERVLALMFKRLHEMDVPEMMASIVLETPGKPWEYYRDMARQIWDECRHALMGEIWFAARGFDPRGYPNHVGWSLSLNQDLTALERHIVLYGIEQGLMDGSRGKRYEWQLAEGADDQLALVIQDYDWADEVLHAQIGRRWLIPDRGDVRTIMEQAAQLSARASPTLTARATQAPQIDWWPEFVRAALGKESTSRPVAANTANALASG
jgi:hypothetical protein